SGPSIGVGRRSPGRGPPPGPRGPRPLGPGRVLGGPHVRLVGGDRRPPLRRPGRRRLGPLRESLGSSEHPTATNGRTGPAPLRLGTGPLRRGRRIEPTLARSRSTGPADGASPRAADRGLTRLPDPGGDRPPDGPTGAGHATPGGGRGGVRSG